MRWYTLCVSSRVHQTEDMPFLDEYSVWIPSIKTLIRNGDDCYLESEPLYPGYIFVGIQANQCPAELERRCKAHNHSFRILRTTGNAQYFMTPADLSAMVEAQKRHAEYVAHHSYKRGEQVKITAGPLVGSTGIVKRVSKRGLVISVSAYSKDLEFAIKRDSFIFVEPYAAV